MYMCIYIHIYMYLYIYIHTHTHIYIYIYSIYIGTFVHDRTFENHPPSLLAPPPTQTKLKKREWLTNEALVQNEKAQETRTQALGYLTSSCSQIQVDHAPIHCQVSFCTRDQCTQGSFQKRHDILHVLEHMCMRCACACQ